MYVINYFNGHTTRRFRYTSENQATLNKVQIKGILEREGLLCL
jgi:hypothetical protein